MDERFWEFLAKYWADRITPEEKAEMERLMLEHPDHWLKTGLMQQISWKPDPMLTDKQADRISDLALGNISGPPPRNNGRKRSRVVYWRIAMIAVVIVLISSFLLVLTRPHTADDVVWQRVMTADGMKTNLRLSDGSELWLNAGSVLRYPDRFEGKTREVFLIGEAYFRIARQDTSVFIVHTEDMDIRALGTEFDVRAYPQEPFTETALMEGSVDVRVNRENQRHQIRLKPFQKIIFRRTASAEKAPDPRGDAVDKAISGAVTRTGDIKLESVDTLAGGFAAENAWQRNVFLFADDPLESLAGKIARWYGVTVQILDSTLARQRFTGSADDPSLEQLLQIMQRTSAFHYKLTHKRLTIQ